ncbi:hypothetical protein JOF28_000543 [Leucobacter exalbidus]|uniref:4Fe-4S Wbl-type domain-containing protein n=1 Tax=Leucobacter exalbidus TaxID=662960 RepID=A0A940PU78_9MICO|nr:hypothetical protein [Leucobacter exalbidus]
MSISYQRTRKHRGVSEQLVEAMSSNRPRCLGDERFTNDVARGDGTAEGAMFAKCFSCPLLAVCEEYADQTKPAAGYWAGRWRGQMPRAQYLDSIRHAESTDHFPSEQEGKGTES